MSGVNLVTGCGRVWLPSSTTSLFIGGLTSFIFLPSCASGGTRRNRGNRRRLEGIEVTDGILHIISQRLERLLDAIPNGEMHIVLGPREAIYLLQGQLHLLWDSQLPFVPFMESVPVLPNLGLIALNGSSAFSVTSSSPPKIPSHILLFRLKYSIFIPRVAREVFSPPLQSPACRVKAWIL